VPAAYRGHGRVPAVSGAGAAWGHLERSEGGPRAAWHREKHTVNDEERYLFDLQGYLVVEGVLSTEEVAELNRLIDRQGLPEPDTLIESQRFGGFLDWGQPFRDLLDHPRVLPYLAELLGPAPRLDHAYGIAMRAGTEGLHLHGGGTPYDPAQHYHFRNEKLYCGLTVVTWALSDAAPGAGGFACIPGSHKSNLPCPGEIRHFRTNPACCVVQVPMNAGDVVIFTEALTHGTYPWSARHHRRALLYKYSPGHMTWGRAESVASRGEGYSERQGLLLEPPYVHRRRPIGAGGARDPY
jgi:ectoine hydroxylase-related dioxygenase (phytanoyl-CoA dioxygenase family)